MTFRKRFFNLVSNSINYHEETHQRLEARNRFPYCPTPESWGLLLFLSITESIPLDSRRSPSINSFLRRPLATKLISSSPSLVMGGLAYSSSMGITPERLFVIILSHLLRMMLHSWTRLPMPIMPNGQTSHNPKWK